MRGAFEDDDEAPGVYITGADGTATFVRAPQLTDDDVQRIVETTAKRVVRLLQRRSVLEESNVDPPWEDEPLLATITAASVQARSPPASVPGSGCAAG